MQYSELQRRIDSAKELDFGEIFNDSIELFKKVWVPGLLTVLLTFAFMIPIFVIFYLPMVLFGLADASNPGEFDNIPVVAVALMVMVYILILLSITVISLGFRAALFKIMANKDNNIQIKDDYFLYLRKPYLSKTIAVALAYLGISLVAGLLCFLPIIYAIVPISLMTVIYTFNPELSTSELVNASFKLGNKKWLITFGLIVVAGILSQTVGMLMCGIGIIFTASFAAIPLYFVYKKSLGAQMNEELDQIGQKTKF